MHTSYTIAQQFESFIQAQLASGRYRSVEDVINEGLQLVQEREQKLQALRHTIHTSIAAGGFVTEEELDASLAATSARLAAEGF